MSATTFIVDRHSLNLKPLSARTLYVYAHADKAQKYSVGLQEIFVSRLLSQEENSFFLSKSQTINNALILHLHPLIFLMFQSLYDYVFCNEQSPHQFKLVSHFPRKVFELDENNDVTLSDVGLTTSATLYVHDLTEENSSEED